MDAEHPHGQLLQALWRGFGQTFTFAGLLKLVHDLLMLTGPVVLQQLLAALQTGRSKREAFGFATLMFAISMAQTLVINQVSRG